MSPTSRSSEPEDVRLRFGMDPPRLEEQRHWEELVPGADEYPTPRVGVLRPVAIRQGSTLIRLSFGAATSEPRTVDEDGEA